MAAAIARLSLGARRPRRPSEAPLRRALIRFAFLAAVLAAAGCASGPPGGPRRHGPPGEDGHLRHRGSQVFISPSGKPFRAGPEAPYPVAAWFGEADANHDGRISRDEFRADADGFFGVVDADHDGVISMVEVTAYETDIAPEITRLNIPGMRDGGESMGPPRGRRGGGHRRGGGGAGRFGGGREGAAMFGLINEPEPIRAADADFSLSVSRAEWRAASDRRFDLLDKDRDGALTLAELPRTPAQGPAPKR